jgi:hypothetical protein
MLAPKSLNTKAAKVRKNREKHRRHDQVFFCGFGVAFAAFAF